MKLGIEDDDPSVTILIIDDSTAERDITVEVLHSLYPLAQITAPINLFHHDIEEFITKGQYTAILVDSCLSQWGSHSQFGEWGENLIPLIKRVSKTSIIVAIAPKDEDNEIMVAKGAKLAVNKRRFLDEKFKGNLPTPYPV